MPDHQLKTLVTCFRFETIPDSLLVINDDISFDHPFSIHIFDACLHQFSIHACYVFVSIQAYSGNDNEDGFLGSTSNIQIGTRSNTIIE